MVLLIDNYDSFTYNLFQYLREAGDEVLVVTNDMITLQDIVACKPSGIIISPGPGRPENTFVSKQVVENLYEQFPILGVCLGHQVIGLVNGCEITGAPNIMHGRVSKIFHNGTGVFKSLPAAFIAARYHSLIINSEKFPARTLEITAATEDGIIMGIRHRKYSHIEGIQFHPESIMTEYGFEIIKNFSRQCKHFKIQNNYCK